MRKDLKIRPAIMIVDEMKVFGVIPDTLHHSLCLCEKLIGQLVATLDSVVSKNLTKIPLNKWVQG